METEIAYMRIENPTGNHDIVRACFAAAGLPWQNAPSEPEEQEHILQEDEDARLVVIALANAMPEAPERMRGTVEWQDFTDPVSDNNTSAIPWCQMLALLSTHEELDDWLERADQHLETARETKRSILPNLAANGAHRNEELISKAVEEATSLHQRKFGETPKGGFALTIGQAAEQWLTAGADTDGAAPESELSLREAVNQHFTLLEGMNSGSTE